MQALSLLFSKLQLFGKDFVEPREASFQTLHWSPEGPQRERRKALQAFIEHQNRLSDIQVKSLLCFWPATFQI